ncbi:indolepyruvate decarboxylase [Vibrio inusitatus NBRC 102082]|uniref:Indolepyruvate decarboxylase n=1 Tax=Vibrio inusitatus NBRC 102082 TaxID=1219070 RepID=A0A4Y3HRU2_9VIBR|nr:thiamine pyrophosphate-binding protein [Vibrio inusitatus]GEA49492.1 indolepyruvate decarboxylase [Vibrio inusitatus NBRC 102082]
MKVTISTYLLMRLKELNVNHLFGIPGDYVLPFFDELIDEHHGVEHVLTRNEMNGTYAADGYSRENGYGAMAVTFGVGSLSCANAVAGAYSDDSPMMVISGAPTVEVINTPTERLLHHVVGTDFDTNLKVFSNITVGAIRLEKQSTATYEIDNLLRKSVQAKKPVYLEIPYDIQTQLVDAPDQPLDLMLEQSSSVNMMKALKDAYEIISSSKTRSVVTGHLLKREHMIEEGLTLVERLNASVSTTFVCKMGDFDSHPNAVGTFLGQTSQEYTVDMMTKADVAIGLGMTFNEFDTGVFTTTMGNNQDVIWIRQNYVEINGKRYDEVYLREFLPKLNQIIMDVPEGEFEPSDKRKFVFERKDKFAPTNDDITIDRLFVQFANYLKPNDMVYGDTGGHINGSQAEFPAGTLFEGCGNWGSLGAGFGIYVGANIANEKRAARSVCISGEGAFTMTGQELATLIEHKKDLALFILDNAGYGAERAINPGKERSYNNIAVWKYEKLGEALGGTEGVDLHSYVVKTEAEMQQVFDKLENPKGVNIVRIMLDPNDSAEFNIKFSGALKH